MKTQTIINCVFAIAFIALAVILVTPRDRNPTFDTITCRGWNVVDEGGKVRIRAIVFDRGTEAVTHWLDQDGDIRISAGTAWPYAVYLPTEIHNPTKGWR